MLLKAASTPWLVKRTSERERYLDELSSTRSHEFRLSLNQRGQAVYALKKPYSDGTTHIVMTQLELLERLAAVVPRPRIHLTRFAGVFAPHYKHRAMIVAKPNVEAETTEQQSQVTQPTKSRIS